MNAVEGDYLRQVLEDHASVQTALLTVESPAFRRARATAERAFLGLFWARCEAILREGWFDPVGRRSQGFGKAVTALLPSETRSDPSDPTGATRIRYADLLPRDRNRITHDERDAPAPESLSTALEVAEDFFARIESDRPTVRPSP